MLGVVQTQASHSLDILDGEGRKQQPDVRNLVGDLMGPENIPGHDPSLSRLGDVGNALRQNGIAIVHLTVPGEESHEPLCPVSMIASYKGIMAGLPQSRQLTWNVGILAGVVSTELQNLDVKSCW
jgi:hypothetical protein